MTNPNPGGVKLPHSPGQTSTMNMPWVTGKVISVDLERNVAQVIDTLTRQIEVRMDIQRGKGSLPEVGETWIIDKAYGAWTFAACLRNESQGVITPIENIPDLAPTLKDKQDQIDTQALRMAGMQLTITVSNVQGTHKRLIDGTLSDGTAVTSVPCAGAYYAQVGDVAWVLRQGVANDANSTPSLIAVGRASVVSGATFGAGTWQRAQITTESAVHIMADKRLTAPSDGVYKVSRGTIDTDGTPIYSSWIDTVMQGNINSPLERNNLLNIGIWWWTGGFYFTKADGTGTSDIKGVGAINASNDIVSDLRITANNFEVTGNSIFSRARDGAMRWNSLGDSEFVTRNGAGYRDIYFWLPKQQAPSWRRLKKDITPYQKYLGGSASEMVGRLEIAGWTYDREVAPDIWDENQHFGPMLDEIPEALIHRNQRDEGDDRSTYDRDGIVGLALAALQEHREEIRRLKAWLAELSHGS